MIICLSYFVILSLQTPFFCSACFYYWAYRPGLTAVVLTQWSPTQILNWPYQKHHSKYKISNPNIWFQVGNTPPEKKIHHTILKIKTLRGQTRLSSRIEESALHHPLHLCLAHIWFWNRSSRRWCRRWRTNRPLTLLLLPIATWLGTGGTAWFCLIGLWPMMSRLWDCL